jgi:hypothetical protein
VYSVPKNIDAKIKGNTHVKGVYHRYRIPPIARVMYFYDAGVTLISPIEYTKFLPDWLARLVLSHLFFHLKNLH